MTKPGPTPAPVVVVTAAVIEESDRFLVTRRLRGTHLEGHWEFPGGKCDPGESLEDCLVREIDEELGCGVQVGREVFSITHAYPERTVELHFFACTLEGEPRPRLGQDMQWAARSALRSLPFPAADRGLIDVLSDPPAPQAPPALERASSPRPRKADAER
jgi:8-oxo-dGTP diphosphatase